ncbi:NifU family protein [Neoroseomonas rubea]|uniref:NifU family protein n=1 Tax=Neoroseomonas rubea TaxID=2748666 RepID=UPI0018E05466|nr:NifU family protein [Roseomonas rubea]
MFIETEATPNPATLKFLPGRDVLGARGTADFTAPGEAAGRSPLAERVFQVGDVARVFLGADFVTVTKDSDADWTMLRPRVLGAIMEHYLSGMPVLEDGEAEGEHGEDFDAADQEVVAQIKELLDTRVRPAVAGDGGDIVFRGFRDGIVRLRMQGACSGCPSSRATLKHGVENMLRHYVPEVVAVEQVEA